MDSARSTPKDQSVQGIYLSRLLTRSGDQAWDFTLPLALIAIFPKNLQIGIGLFFLSKLLFALLIPAIGAQMDRWRFETAVRLGIGLQTAGVFFGATLIFCAYQHQNSEEVSSQILMFAWFSAVALTMLASSIGSQIMDVFVSHEIIPALYPQRLTDINAKIRQIDLITEVGSPVVTGLILATSIMFHPLLGFALIALWNVVSFIPEYILIRPYLSQMSTKARESTPPAPKSIFRKYKEGYRAFKHHRLAVPVITYALLWLSALSPHGVLLTTFLKGAWQLHETELGFFRALGAVCGVSATFLFPLLAKRLKIIRASACFIAWQGATVLTATFLFTQNAPPWYFLIAVLLSRIGLYGFIQGETELRQTLTSPGERGRLNGFASALNQSAALFLFFLGTIFTSPSEFIVLIATSAFSVSAGALLFLWWARKIGAHTFQSRE